MASLKPPLLPILLIQALIMTNSVLLDVFHTLKLLPDKLAHNGIIADNNNEQIQWQYLLNLQNPCQELNTSLQEPALAKEGTNNI